LWNTHHCNNIEYWNAILIFRFFKILTFLIINFHVRCKCITVPPLNHYHYYVLRTSRIFFPFIYGLRSNKVHDISNTVFFFILCIWWWSPFVRRNVFWATCMLIGCEFLFNKFWIFVDIALYLWYLGCNFFDVSS